MKTLTAWIDRFVRWFFDTSPRGQMIGGRWHVPRRSDGVSAHEEVVRRRALVLGTAIAVALLGIFYSVVAGAVDRAAVRRAHAVTETVAWRAPDRAPAQPAYFAARKVSLARASN
jgi:hypothetical protein